MRCIGHLENEEAATTFRDFLYTEGIASHVESESANEWAVWVEAEDHLEQATAFLSEFSIDPRAARFKSKAREGASRRSEERKSDEAYARKIKTRQQVFRPLILAGLGPLSLALIIVSVIAFLTMQTPAGQPWLLRYLSFSTQTSGMPEIRQGELWRLVTPIFIHFGFLHILFNALWLRDLGGMIELRQGTGQLALLVVGIAICSNLFQYYGGSFAQQLAAATGQAELSQAWRLVADELGGTLFGGLSGVNYGLFGYIWLRSRFDPGSGLFLRPYTVVWMLAWFVLCFTPVLGHIANGAHLAGLAVGAAWGWLSSLKYR